MSLTHLPSFGRSSHLSSPSKWRIGTSAISPGSARRRFTATRRLPCSFTVNPHQWLVLPHFGQKLKLSESPRTYGVVVPEKAMSSPSHPYAQRVPYRLQAVQLQAVADLGVSFRVQPTEPQRQVPAIIMSLTCSRVVVAATRIRGWATLIGNARPNVRAKSRVSLIAETAQVPGTEVALRGARRGSAAWPTSALARPAGGRVARS